MEEIQVNLANRWFLGCDLDEAVPDHSVLSQARARSARTCWKGRCGSIDVGWVSAPS